MKSKKIYLSLILLAFSIGVNVSAEESTVNNKEMASSLEKKEENVDDLYEAAINDLELNKQRDILTQEQIDEFMPSLINSTTIDQIKDNMTKFYSKYDVYPKLEFNERLVNMKNYILGLISSKNISEEVGNQFIHQIDQSTSYDELNGIQKNVDKLLSGNAVVNSNSNENKAPVTENVTINKTVKNKEMTKKEQEVPSNEVIAVSKKNTKQAGNSSNQEVNKIEEEGNSTKNPSNTPVSQGNVMAFLPKTGISGNTAILSLSGFFLFIGIIAITELRNNKNKLKQ
ncbi:hypothetical protein H9L18_14305 [Vagococcus carniphilus]|uniref:Gram-positive cocci surface proteins LPxTG domain-containing protein n=1 Tax=Vagococcus carniphilus TaxID=218144 RepID=A0A430B010_9ENTE|nr:hypothetical protein [Vagococcus carniphilus]QNN73001.1 hypothetical protein H9L18_14305 [Vagococcus carniphilus]RSU13648.1 hypothetical protein CBF28_09170 [Vagococcus carniphilus]